MCNRSSIIREDSMRPARVPAAAPGVSAARSKSAAVCCGTVYLVRRAGRHGRRRDGAEDGINLNILTLLIKFNSRTYNIHCFPLYYSVAKFQPYRMV